MLPSSLFLGLGGNQAGTEPAFCRAISKLSLLFPLQMVSSLYVTAPQDYIDQPDFLNMVIAFELPYDFVPIDAISQIFQIETDLGRVRDGIIAKGPRLIDIDILLIGNQIIHTETLIVPHPRMKERRFVLEPLLEIAPELQDPVNQQFYRDLLPRTVSQAIYSTRLLQYTDPSL